MPLDQPRIASHAHIRNRVDAGDTGRRPTLADIARQAGVSIATVSKVLNGRSGYSEATRQKVNDALATLGYQRTGHAGEPNAAIELAVQHLDSDWILGLLRGIERVVRPLRIGVTVSMVDDLAAMSSDWIVEAADRNPVGAIPVCSTPDADIAERFEARGIPCVFLDPVGAPADGLLSVRADNWSGGFLAAQHLIDLGHTRIGVISGPSNAMNATARLAGVRAAFTAAGLTLGNDMCIEATFRMDGGRDAAIAQLNRPEPPTAIITGNDVQAMGVYEAARRLNIAIPYELSVIGYDDIRAAQYLAPPLTTIHQPLEEMGAKAAELILAARDGNDATGNFILPTTLAERESTVAPLDL